MADLSKRAAVLEQPAAHNRGQLAGLGSDLRRVAHSDFRWLMGVKLGGFSVSVAGLIGIMAHRFGWW